MSEELVRSLDNDAILDVAKTHHRKLNLRYHSDRTGSGRYNTKVQEINEAYTTLGKDREFKYYKKKFLKRNTWREKIENLESEVEKADSEKEGLSENIYKYLTSFADSENTIFAEDTTIVLQDRTVYDQLGSLRRHYNNDVKSGDPELRKNLERIVGEKNKLDTNISKLGDEISKEELRVKKITGEYQAAGGETLVKYQSKERGLRILKNRLSKRYEERGILEGLEEDSDKYLQIIDGKIEKLRKAYGKYSLDNPGKASEIVSEMGDLMIEKRKLKEGSIDPTQLKRVKNYTDKLNALISKSELKQADYESYLAPYYPMKEKHEKNISQIEMNMQKLQKKLSKSREERIKISKEESVAKKKLNAKKRKDYLEDKSALEDDSLNYFKISNSRLNRKEGEKYIDIGERVVGLLDEEGYKIVLDHYRAPGERTHQKLVNNVPISKILGDTGEIPLSPSLMTDGLLKVLKSAIEEGDYLVTSKKEGERVNFYIKGKIQNIEMGKKS